MEWQPIETAPKDGTIVLLLVVPKYRRGWRGISSIPLPGYAFDGLDFSWVALNHDLAIGGVDATHWMPLPPPPAEQGE